MKKKFPAELRMDVVSEDWVIVAADRKNRPSDYGGGSKKCPFCDINTQNIPVLVLVNGERVPLYKKVPKDWSVAIIPNKYPALVPYFKLEERIEGELYKKMNAVGFHEVIVLRDHNKDIGKLSVEKVKELIDAYQMRYLDIMDKKFVNHISIFHNHGPNSGASIIHPHSQIITTVLLDVDMKNALMRAKAYYNKKKKCLYCQMMKYELKSKKRIVFENKHFVVLCPYASKTSFQTIISPKKHLSYFERIKEEEKQDLAEALKVLIHKIDKGLKNPSYNYYLHTAPADDKKHNYYHWHFTVLPKTQNWAGFEIGTRLEIVNISPEDAAKYLRKI